MNQKLIVVLLLVTIVLSITSMAVIFTISPGELDTSNFARPSGIPIDPDDSGTLGFAILSPGGTG